MERSRIDHIHDRALRGEVPCWQDVVALCDAALANAVDCEGLAQKLVQIVDEDATEPDLLLPRHALHAAGLIFPHPETGQPVEVQSELPPDLADFFAREG